MMYQFAVSSWSLDGMLTAGMPLLDIPAQLQEQGLTTFELCHFHLPTTDTAYLQALRERLRAADITLSSVLIDAGDIAAPDATQQAADVTFIQDNIRMAATLGAARVRIDAGLQAPTPDVIRQSAHNLRALVAYAATHGVQVSTENWHATGHDPDALVAILDQCASPLGLCVDTGNAESTRDKYATLTQLLPHATSVHFKARYTPSGAVEQTDVQQCLALFQAAAFAGIVTLIYDRKQDEWAGIRSMRDAWQAAF